MKLVDSFVVLAVSLAYIQDGCLALPVNKHNKKETKNKSREHSLQFLDSTASVLSVDLRSSLKIDCSVVDDDDDKVEYSLYYTPALSQPVQERNMTLEGGVFDLANIEMRDYGHYYCYAQRGENKIMKNITIVPSAESFVPEPIITPQTITATSGDNLKLTCTCWSDKCDLSWEVEKDYGEPDIKENVIKGTGYSKRELVFLLKDTTRPLKITCISKYQDSEYKSAVNFDWKPPFIASLPNKVHLPEGSSVEIECVATGFPIPLISWLKLDDSSFSSWNCEKNKICQGNYIITGDYGQKLKILNADKKSNSGRYGCFAMNLYSMYEKTFEVIVQK